VKVLVKVSVLVLINFLLFKFLYLDYVNRFVDAHTTLEKVHNEPEYRYWLYENAIDYCSEDSIFSDSQIESKKEDIQNKIDNLIKTKGNVIYFKNIDLINCLKNIKNIAVEFHIRGFQIAFNLENTFDYQKIYGDDFSRFDLNPVREKFKDATFVSDWVDYIVVDNAMEFMTYTERHSLYAELRTIFNKPFLGFRFTRHYDLDPDTTHPNRPDKKIADFLPKEDDGDFIITSIPVKDFKRTMVFIEGKGIDRVRVNGEILD
jgi:hypothetical protein